MTPSLVVNTEAEYNRVVNSYPLVFINAWATWHDEWVYIKQKGCQLKDHNSCAFIEPTFMRMALKYGDKAKFISIDVDELPQLCNRVLGVRFMPVLIVVKDGIKFKHMQSKVPIKLKEFVKTIIESDG